MEPPKNFAEYSALVAELIRAVAIQWNHSSPEVADMAARASESIGPIYRCFQAAGVLLVRSEGRSADIAEYVPYEIPTTGDDGAQRCFPERFIAATAHEAAVWILYELVLSVLPLGATPEAIAES